VVEGFFLKYSFNFYIKNIYFLKLYKQKLLYIDPNSTKHPPGWLYVRTGRKKRLETKE